MKGQTVKRYFSLLSLRKGTSVLLVITGGWQGSHSSTNCGRVNEKDSEGERLLPEQLNVAVSELMNE